MHTDGQPPSQTLRNHRSDFILNDDDEGDDHRENNPLTDREFFKTKEMIKRFSMSKRWAFSHQISIDMCVVQLGSNSLTGLVIRFVQVCSFHVLVCRSIDKEATYLLFECSSNDYLFNRDAFVDKRDRRGKKNRLAAH